MSDSSQKFIGRNRPPRVQIEYDVELYGAEKVVQIPFVMGVMTDLKGNVPDDSPEPVDQRKFLDIDADNFNDRLKAMKPHVKVSVPNTITGEGNLVVDLTFESMDDFTPGAIARNVKGIKELLEARTQLDSLLTHMDGKSGAEEIISHLIKDETLMQTLIAAAQAGGADAASADQPSTKEE